MSNRPELETLSVHAGEELDEEFGAIAPPLVLASSFAVDPDSVGFSAYDYAEEAPYFYSRWSNPTVRRLERKLAALEGAEDGVCFASGMAAISGLILHTLSAGDHLILSNACYAAVAELAHDTLPRLGIAASAVDTSDLAAIEGAIRPTTKLIYVETPCNPILRLADVKAIAGLAKAHGARLAVDSTIATPLGLQPLALGADFVVHSLTKYLCGHGDALGGAVLGRAEAIDGLRKDSLVHLGGLLGAFDAWLILRSLHSLPARMATHEAGAAEVAAFLEGHPRIERVLYPGLASHPQRALAEAQMTNSSGLLAFTARDGAALARQLAARLKVFTYAVSLGKSKSLVFYIPTEDIQRTSFRLGEADLAGYRAWAGEGVFRVSVGLERPADLIADLEQALAN